MSKILVLEKINQAVHILREQNIDLWVIFVRESSAAPDPCVNMVVGTNCTWQSAFFINRTGDTTAIVGSLEVPNMEITGTYRNVIGYLQSAQQPIVDYLETFNPQRIAVNYSVDSNLADGLTHGMYLTLKKYLKDTPYAQRFVSSENIVAALRGRKSTTEIDFMKDAIRHTLEIYDMVTAFLKPGQSEKEVAAFITAQIKARGLEPAWDEEHCPSVFTGPETAGAHSGPTDRQIEKGHIINMDFGVKCGGYCSDLQRTWYMLRDGEDKAPAEVQRGFDILHQSISKAAAAISPGVDGCTVDSAARNHITSNGYAEYQHGLGHQVGKAAHDGGAGLFPAWERYGGLPFLPLEENQVFTIEPRLFVEGHGVVTIEEMIKVTRKGVQWLSDRQDKLWLVK